MQDEIGGSTPGDPVLQNGSLGGYSSAHAPGDREWARKRILRRRGLYAHAAAYVVVNLFLVAIWWFTGAGYFWPGWVIAGWGIGLVLDAASVLWQTEITDEQIESELRNRRT